MTRPGTSDLVRLVPAREACRQLGISRRTLSRLLARREPRGVKLRPHQRGRVLIPAGEIERYIARMVRA